MKNDNHIDDNVLVGFLDGRLSSSQARDIEAALATDTQLQDRLAGLSINMPRLKNAFDGMLPFAPKLQLPLRQKTSQSRLWFPTALAASVALIGGLLVGQLLPQSPSMRWQDQVASYHNLYGPATLADVNLPEAQAKKELARVVGTIGKSIPIETFRAAPGLSYRRAQILQFDGRPLVQLSFTKAGAAPLALCIRRSSETEAYEPRSETLQGLAAVHWSEGGYAYILIGGSDKSVLTDALSHFRGKV